MLFRRFSLIGAPLLAALFTLSVAQSALAQEKERFVVVSIDTEGLDTLSASRVKKAAMLKFLKSESSKSTHFFLASEEQARQIPGEGKLSYYLRAQAVWINGSGKVSASLFDESKKELKIKVEKKVSNSNLILKNFEQALNLVLSKLESSPENQ